MNADHGEALVQPALAFAGIESQELSTASAFTYA